MKILLIKPPANAHLLSAPKSEPLELEYLAASVAEHKVSILDMRLDRNLERELDRFKPDLVGITAYTCDAKTAGEVLREVKKTDARIRTVVGGHHATFLPHDFAVPHVDAVFLGLADVSFKKYVAALAEGGDVEGVANIGLREGDGLRFTAKVPSRVNLTELPFPARQLTRHYRKSYRDVWGNRTALVLTSRGCPFRCTFCACWKVMDGKYITRDPASVVEEFKSLPEDIDFVALADDNTLQSVGRAKKLSEMMAQGRLGRKFSMYARADTIVGHPGLIEGFLEAGLEYLIVGLESCGDEGLARLNKKTSVEMNNRAIGVLQKAGISIFAHLIVDPDFSEDDFQRVLDYVNDKKLFRLSYSILTPLPGTDLFERSRDRLAIRDFDYYDFAHAIFPTRLERKEFYRQFARLYKESYSWRRYVRLMLKEWTPWPLNSGHRPEGKDDRFPLAKIILLNLFGYPLYRRTKNLYKEEPLLPVN